MNCTRRIVVRTARAMISDGVIVSGLVPVFLGDAYLWWRSGDWWLAPALPDRSSGCDGGHSVGW
jgi:hypothetical protein